MVVYLEVEMVGDGQKLSSELIAWRSTYFLFQKNSIFVENGLDTSTTAQSALRAKSCQYRLPACWVNGQ